MYVKELKKLLEKLPDDAECYTSVWFSEGERQYRMSAPLGANNVSPSGKYVRLSWVDNCPAHMISPSELK